MSMRKISVMIFSLSFFIVLAAHCALAIEVAPRISDKEIIEKLSELKEGQKSLESRIETRFEAIDNRFEAIDKWIDDLRSEMNSKFDALRSEMNSRFDTLTWILSLFITISTITLGFVIRMQFQMEKRLSQVETSLETQKDELKFFKGLIEKLLPPPHGSL